MTRKRLLWFVPVGVAAIGIAAYAMRAPQDDMATFRVEPMEFARRVTAEGTLKAVKATPVTVPPVPQPLKLAWIAPDGSRLKAGDVIARFDPTELENLLLSGREDRATATNKLTKTNTETSATSKNLKRDAKLAQTELDAAKKFKFDDAEVFSRYQRIESEVDEQLAGNRKQHAEEVLGVREKLATADRDLITIEDRKAGLKITKAEEGLRALHILSPHDGILVLIRDWRGEVRRVGDTCWPGMPIGEIPELTAMQAEVFVLEADAAGLAVDQKVTLSMESNPGQQFQGKVKSVDKIARPRFRNVPVQYFGVTVALDKTDPKMMKPGTRVRALLEIENVKDAFAVPRQALFDKEGKKIVYRKKGDRYEPVEVTIGSSSAGRVVVTKGLRKGDELALKDPTKEDDGEQAASDEHA